MISLRRICRQFNQSMSLIFGQTFEQRAQGRGERQAAPTLEGIRSDHIARYQFACRFIPDRAKILDLACGIGYGSQILATQTNCQAVQAIDKSRTAIKYAKQFYGTNKIAFQVADGLKMPLPNQYFDVVTSFETIEHVPDASILLNQFFTTLKPGGLLICSTPNQNELPYNQQEYPFHFRHYTPSELQTLTSQLGFQLMHVYAQPSRETSEIIEGWNGLFNILILTKLSP